MTTSVKHHRANLFGLRSLLLRGWVIDNSFSEFVDFSEVARSPTFFDVSMSNIFANLYFIFSSLGKDLAYDMF